MDFNEIAKLNSDEIEELYGEIEELYNDDKFWILADTYRTFHCSGNWTCAPYAPYVVGSNCQNLGGGFRQPSVDESIAKMKKNCLYSGDPIFRNGGLEGGGILAKS